MRKIILVMIVVLGTTNIIKAQESDSSHLGQNFSLEGALAIFKKAGNLEEFEKLINNDGCNVNNLDLNDDQKIDYINVDEIKEGDTHVIVLSTFINEKEKQDIASIGIEKTGSEQAILQIQGDEDLYPLNTIVEPIENKETPIKSKGGPANYEFNVSPIVVNVWFWPSVRYIYAPSYRVYKSPYRWAYYPNYWKPWKPYHRTVFYTRSAPNRISYGRAPINRVVISRNIYAPRRNSSTYIIQKRKGYTVVTKKENGNVRVVKKGRPIKKRIRAQRRR